MKKKIDITVYGCEPDEAAVFNKLSYEFGVTVSLISRFGKQCKISRRMPMYQREP